MDFNCVKCCNPISKQDEFLKCDACLIPSHKKCTELTPSELKCIPLQKRSLWFLCDTCVQSMRRMPVMLNMIEEMQKNIEQIKNEISKSSSETPSRKYSEVLQGKPEQVLVVKPISKQESRSTKNDIKKAINPTEIGVNITKIKQATNGAIVIGCENSEERHLLQTKITEKLNEKYNVEIPQLKKPKIKIANINNEDIDQQETEIIRHLVKQNSIDNQRKDFHLKILKVIENKKFKNSSLIVEVDPITYKCLLNKEKVNLGWSRGPVYNYVSILQCFKCQGFNHLAKNCEHQETCSICADSHNYKQCNSKEVKCTNCSKAKIKLNIDVDINHSALDKKCPCYLRLMKIKNQRIEYSSE